jgi:hypothetical protein
MWAVRTTGTGGRAALEATSYPPFIVYEKIQSCWLRERRSLQESYVLSVFPPNRMMMMMCFLDHCGCVYFVNLPQLFLNLSGFFSSSDLRHAPRTPLHSRPSRSIPGIPAIREAYGKGSKDEDVAGYRYLTFSI